MMPENCYKKTNRWALVLLIPCMLIWLPVIFYVEMGILDARIGWVILCIDIFMWALTVCMIGTYLENVEKMGS